MVSWPWSLREVNGALFREPVKLVTLQNDHNQNGHTEWDHYRQMGELWTLFEFACSLHLTCNMVLEMDGGISRVLLCIMIFSILRLYGIKFSMN